MTKPLYPRGSPLSPFGPVYSIGEAAKFLGLHVNTLRNWDRSGKFSPSLRVGTLNHRRYSTDDLNKIRAFTMPKEDIAFNKSIVDDERQDIASSIASLLNG